MKLKVDSVLAYLCAAIFLQTLFFKFTGAPESIWIFETLGVEPWGRYLSGVMELIASIVLIRSSTRLYGALLSMGIMAGAILSHITILGIVVENDGGLLFTLASVCFISATVIVFLRRKELPLKLFSSSFLIFLPLLSMAKVSYNNESEFGIHGYDPVSYIEVKKAQEGRKEYQFSLEGITYLFSTEAHKQLFIKEPQKYIPAYGGWCAYAMAEGEKVDIDPKNFKLLSGKVYLFYNGIWGDTLKKWNKDEEKLKMNADKAWMKIIQ